MKHLFLLSLLCLSLGLQAQQKAYMTDPRTGRIYETITLTDSLLKIEFTIMAENLDHEMPGSWAYDNDTSYRKDLGLLYNGEAATEACPTGWHLPSESDWDQIVNLLGGSEKAGNAMKASTDWHDGGNGTNSSGFNGLPGGCRNYDGGFSGLGEKAYWWSAPESNTGEVRGRYLYSSNGKIHRYYNDEEQGLSIRCLKD